MKYEFKTCFICLPSNEQPKLEIIDNDVDFTAVLMLYVSPKITDPCNKFWLSRHCTKNEVFH